jgi:hypothetical protein
MQTTKIMQTIDYVSLTLQPIAPFETFQTFKPKTFDSMPFESDYNLIPRPRSPSKVISWLTTLENPKLEICAAPNADAGVKATYPQKRTGLIKHKRAAAFKKEVQDSPLHFACLNPATTAKEIEALLCQDYAAASRQVKVKTTKWICHPVTRKAQEKVVNELYTYPIHIAIKNGLDKEVIGILLDAAPSVLNMRDGPQLETPLALLLRTRPQEIILLDVMLLQQPSCAFICDRHDNTVLHLACVHGGSVDVLHHLCLFFPQGLKSRNFHGKTPHELCQQRGTCSEEVSYFMAENEKQGLC